MTAGLKLGLIAAAMTGFLVFMLVSHETARATGTEIEMSVEGYDPRDIFLGHYAEIRTPLSRIDLASVEGDDTFEPYQRVFVTLEIGADGLARPAAVHRAHPGSGLVAEGRVSWVDEALVTRFNIERYYADRDEALALQARLRGGIDGEFAAPVRVILSLTGSGRLMIKGFEIDGERRIDRLW